MTRYVIDSSVAIRLARDKVTEHSGHELLSPTLLRSQTLSTLHAAVYRGDLVQEEAEHLLDRIASMSIRLLGDRVLRTTAWKVADDLGWADTFDAEYIALTMLQADAFITLDASLARSAQTLVETAAIDVLYPGN